MALWDSVLGRHQIEASGLSTREATAFDRCSRCASERADFVKVGTVLLDVVMSATGTVVVFVVGDVLGGRNAHLVDSEAEFRRQAEEVEGFAWSNLLRDR